MYAFHSLKNNNELEKETTEINNIQKKDDQSNKGNGWKKISSDLLPIL